MLASFMALLGWSAGPSGPIISSNAWPWPGDQVSVGLQVPEQDCWGLEIISGLRCPVVWFLTQEVSCLSGEGVWVPLGILCFSF